MLARRAFSKKLMHKIDLERRLLDLAWRIWYGNNCSSLTVEPISESARLRVSGNEGRMGETI